MIDLSPKHLRNVAGSFATGVAVVSIDSSSVNHAMTVNSFLSVSLEPPLLLFSVDKKASMLDLIHVGGYVGISILLAEQKDISNHFASIKKMDESPGFRDYGMCKVLGQALAVYSTQVDNVIEAGDHYLVICRILHCERSTGDPLIYYAGYKQIGDEI